MPMLVIALSMIPFIAFGGLQEQLESRKQASKAKVPQSAKAVMGKVAKDLERRKLENNAPQIGAKFPDFAFENGTTLRSLIQKGPVVLKLYRGGWCPYCVLELKEYQRILKTIQGSNIQIVAVAPETAQQVKATKRKNRISFMVFSDPGNKLAKTLGISFLATDELMSVYKGFGIDLVKNQGTNRPELPYPATFVIGMDGKVKFRFVDPDYTKRAEPSEVLNAAKQST